jgi:hypothetical protein
LLHEDRTAEINRFALPGKSEPYISQLERFKQMAQTRNAAMGGSPTMPLMAHAGDLASPVPSGLFGNLRNGNVTGVLGNLGTLAQTYTGGPNEATRNHLLNMLASGRAPLSKPLPQGVKSQMPWTPAQPAAPVPVDIKQILKNAEARNIRGQNMRNDMRRALTTAPVPVLPRKRPDGQGY